MALYKVDEKDLSLRPFRAIPLGEHHTESRLEDWLEKSPEVLLGDEPLLVIGRQVNSPVGVVDLLAVDSLGIPVIIELKRAPSQREAISQGLEYASWVASLDFASLEEVANAYFRHNGSGQSFADAWKEAYGTELKPDRLNAAQRVFVVVEGEDARLQSFVKYLRTKGNDISLYQYDFYRSDGGEELLNIHLEVGESETVPQEDQKPSEQRLTEAWGELLTESYEAFRDTLFEGGLYSQPKKSGMSFLIQTKKWPVFICFFNEGSSGPSVWIRADSMSITFPFADAARELEASLPKGSSVKHSNVWYMISFRPSRDDGQRIAALILDHFVEPVLAKMNA